MKVEIWSDVMCPFCYIGKRRFENALQQFPHKDEIEIEWKSFQLDPHLKTEPGKSADQMLSDKKGWTLDQAVQAHDHVTKMAREVGLEYNFNKAVVANSFDAHRFSHLAAKHGLQDKAEERLFKAYFTKGENIDDTDTLVRLGKDIGLDPVEVKQMLESDLYSEQVNGDITEAQELGIGGVPFFVINRRYAVSGAQPSEAFLQALNKAWSEK